jgi:hypothetical protein
MSTTKEQLYALLSKINQPSLFCRQYNPALMTELGELSDAVRNFDYLVDADGTAAEQLMFDLEVLHVALQVTGSSNLGYQSGTYDRARTPRYQIDQSKYPVDPLLVVTVNEVLGCLQLSVAHQTNRTIRQPIAVNNTTATFDFIKAIMALTGIVLSANSLLLANSDSGLLQQVKNWIILVWELKAERFDIIAPVNKAVVVALAISNVIDGNSVTLSPEQALVVGIARTLAVQYEWQVKTGIYDLNDLSAEWQSKPGISGPIGHVMNLYLTHDMSPQFQCVPSRNDWGQPRMVGINTMIDEPPMHNRNIVTGKTVTFMSLGDLTLTVQF